MRRPGATPLTCSPGQSGASSSAQRGESELPTAGLAGMLDARGSRLWVDRATAGLLLALGFYLLSSA